MTPPLNGSRLARKINTHRGSMASQNPSPRKKLQGKKNNSINRVIFLKTEDC